MDARWLDLEPHALRDTVFLLSANVDILDVGEALAANDTARVQAWIQDEALRRPHTEELARWKEEPGKLFSTLIVHPFVLIQETDLPPASTEEGPGDVTIEELARYLAARQER